MITGTTTSGFSFELEEEIFDDYELLEMLHKIDRGDNGMMIEMVDKLLGVEQRERLKNHVRTEKGRVPAKRLFEEIKEIFQANKTTKN